MDFACSRPMCAEKGIGHGLQYGSRTASPPGHCGGVGVNSDTDALSVSSCAVYDGISVSQRPPVRYLILSLFLP